MAEGMSLTSNLLHLKALIYKKQISAPMAAQWQFGDGVFT